MHYEWRHDGARAGEDSPVLRIQRITDEDAGSYICTVTDARGSAVSDSAKLAIDTASIVPAAADWAVAAAASACCIAAACWLIFAEGSNREALR
jgi:hypothetical protein